MKPVLGDLNLWVHEVIRSYSMSRNKQGQLIAELKSFKTEAFNPQGERVEVESTGLWATWDRRRVYLNYAGDGAQEADCLMELPRDPAVLKAMAKGLSALAKKLAEE